MLIKTRSILTGITHTRDIDVTPEQIHEWENGGLIQDVLPHLSPDDREFLMTGITPKEWEENFSKSEDDDLNQSAVDEAEYRGNDYGDDDA